MRLFLLIVTVIVLGIEAVSASQLSHHPTDLTPSNPSQESNERILPGATPSIQLSSDTQYPFSLSSFQSTLGGVTCVSQDPLPLSASHSEDHLRTIRIHLDPGSMTASDELFLRIHGCVLSGDYPLRATSIQTLKTSDTHSASIFRKKDGDTLHILSNIVSITLQKDIFLSVAMSNDDSESLLLAVRSPPEIL